MLERFYISGCQRSGTTMLRLVLESHSSIQCFDEGVGYNLLISSAKAEEKPDLSVTQGILLQGFKIPRFAEQLTWQEFSDPDYGVFNSFYRGEKVVHIVRDVRDVVVSMMELKVSFEMSWLEMYGIRILGAIVQNPYIDKVYKDKYRELKQRGMPLHLVGALYWDIKNQGYFALKKVEKPVCAVKYEHLVDSPKEILQQICCFLEVDWGDSLLEHPAHPHDELNERGIAIGNTDSKRSIDTNSVGRYKDYLTEQQEHDIQVLTRTMRMRLDSELCHNAE